MKLLKMARFGMIASDVLEDPELSLRAKGLYGYLQSKPDGWRFSIERIAKENKEGKGAIRSAIRELEDKGFLIRKPVKDSKGKWGGFDYMLLEHPFTENLTVSPGKSFNYPSSENPSSDNPSSENRYGNIKKDIEKNSNKKIDSYIVREALSYFLKRYKDVFGVEYIVNWGRDTKIMKKVMSMVGNDVELVKKVIDRFFEVKTAFYERSGWALHILLSDINGLVMAEKRLRESEEVKRKISELVGEIVKKKGVAYAG